jgi:hypothetical protein
MSIKDRKRKGNREKKKIQEKLTKSNAMFQSFPVAAVPTGGIAIELVFDVIEVTSYHICSET